jgi:hypothetical protein
MLMMTTDPMPKGGGQIVSNVGSQGLGEYQVFYDERFDPKNAALSYKNSPFWRVYDEDSI